jgi:hypothetical protein
VPYNGVYHLRCVRTEGDIIDEEFRPNACGCPNAHSPHSFRLTILDICKSLGARVEVTASDIAEVRGWEGEVIHFDTLDTAFLLI